MKMFKYIIKRILLMVFVLFVIVTICFFLVRLLPRQEAAGNATQQEALEQRWEAYGYNDPLIEQYGNYLYKIVNIFNAENPEEAFGISWYIDYREPALTLLLNNLLPTVVVNVYSLLFSIPVGIGLGIYAAIKKNKWQDTLISTAVMVFISVPSYVYAFLLKYVLYYELNIFNNSNTMAGNVLSDRLAAQKAGIVLTESNAWTVWLTLPMFISMIMPILALSFGTIAGLCRFTRAELTETLTSDYMLLARTKGLTRAQATSRHALKNAMVPILPMIISSFVGILGGSFIIETIFGIPGVGSLYIQSINGTYVDYDVFMIDTIFYTLIGLAANILVDISYGFIDPRIRMGER